MRKKKVWINKALLLYSENNIRGLLQFTKRVLFLLKTSGHFFSYGTYQQFRFVNLYIQLCSVKIGCFLLSFFIIFIPRFVLNFKMSTHILLSGTCMSIDNEKLHLFVVLHGALDQMVFSTSVVFNSTP